MKNQNENQNYPIIISALPFTQRCKHHLKSWFEEKVLNMKFPWKKLVVFGVFLLVVGFIYLLVLLNQVTIPQREEFQKEHFESAETFQLSHGEQTIIENDRFVLVFNNETTLFEITDKVTTKTWSSNPDVSQDRFLNPIRLYYAGSLGQVSPISVKEEAIDYQDFSIYLDGNQITVLYEVGGKKEIDKFDFPQIITNERMESLILSKLVEGSTDYRRITEQAYVSGNVDGVDVWKLKDGIQSSILNQLYRIMYETCGYTVENLQEDFKAHGIVVEDTYPYFEIAVSYTLTETGLEVELINDSIVEKEKYPLIYIDVLPYFGAGTTTDEGYLFVPDGSGALITFNSNRSFALPYNKRIFGKDYATYEPIQGENTPSIKLPVIGMTNNQNGFISVASTGAEMAYVYANVSTQDNPYNQVFYRYYLREGDLFEFSSINSSVSINEWSDWYNTKDFALDYLFISEPNCTYEDMAKTYQDYLLDTGFLTSVDETNTPVLDLTLLGGYVIDENFLGIPYKTVKSLTSTTQALTIVNQLKQDSIEHINLFYQGFSNDGLKPTYYGDLSFNRRTGTKNDFMTLQKELENQNVSFYPEVLLNSAFTSKNINEKEMVIRDVFGKVVSNYAYNPASLIQDLSTREQFKIKPNYFVETLANIQKTFTKMDLNGIAFTDFGSQIYGSYDKKETYFRTDFLDYFNQTMDQSQDMKYMFRNANLYAIPYASVLTDMDIAASNYQIITHSVPFFQLVFSGYIDYSSKSFNTDDEFSYQYHLLKAIETGSNIALTWSYESTIGLVETEYSEYYSTYYLNWYDRLLQTNQELLETGVYETQLVGHELVTEDGLVSISTYQNRLKIMFNYRNTPYNHLGVNVESYTYYILEGGN